jgi:hypothetical protein
MGTTKCLHLPWHVVLWYQQQVPEDKDKAKAVEQLIQKYCFCVPSTKFKVNMSLMAEFLPLLHRINPYVKGGKMVLENELKVIGLEEKWRNVTNEAFGIVNIGTWPKQE